MHDDRVAKLETALKQVKQILSSSLIDAMFLKNNPCVDERRQAALKIINEALGG